MTKTINIGFVGCGANARGHMEALEKMDDARVCVVCDVAEESARSAAELTGAEATTKLDRLLARDDLHAVYLSLPVFAHGEPELAVIRRGLPFFVEKPVARTMATARRIAAEVQRSDLLTCVGYQLRYGAGTTAARTALEDHTIGLIVGQYWSGTGRGDRNRWTMQYEKSGGQILEQATHTFDMMRYLCGEVTRVSAHRANRQLHDIDCADVHVVALTFASGALGSMTTTWAYDPSDWSHANILHITYADHVLRWTADATTRCGGGETRELTAEDACIDRVFIDAVRSGDRSAILSPYDDAVKSLELCLAINESAENDGKPVTLTPPSPPPGPGLTA